MIKRMALAALTFILLLSVIAACADPESKPVDTEPDSPPSETHTDGSLAPPTVTTPGQGGQEGQTTPPTAEGGAAPGFNPPIEVPDNVRETAGMIAGAMRSGDFETAWGLSSDEAITAFLGEVMVFDETDPGDIVFKQDDALFRFISPGDPDLYRHFATELISVDSVGDGVYIRFTLNVYHEYEYPTYEVFKVSGYALTGEYALFSYPGAVFNDSYSVHISGQVVDGRFEGTVTTEIHFNHGGVSVTEEEWVNGLNRANPTGAFPSDGLPGYVKFIASLPNW